MPPITTIVHFQVPAENADRFLDFWQDSVREEVGRQPGLIDGIFHRAIDPDETFQFINVARWENAELLTAALQAAEQALRRDGIEIAQVFADLGVTATQDNYLEAVRYVGNALPPQHPQAAGTSTEGF